MNEKLFTAKELVEAELERIQRELEFIPSLAENGEKWCRFCHHLVKKQGILWVCTHCEMPYEKLIPAEWEHYYHERKHQHKHLHYALHHLKEVTKK
jgi:hypothetical protein